MATQCSMPIDFQQIPFTVGMGEKQRGRGGVNIPTDDQVRLAKLTLDGPAGDDANLQKLIKKVIETTRCTVAQAEVALFDTDNDVQSAVLSILDSNGKAETWTAPKSRKAKKDEAKEEETRSYTRRDRAPITDDATREVVSSRRGGTGGGRGASAPRAPRNEGGRRDEKDGGGRTGDRAGGDAAPSGGTQRGGSGGFRGGRGGGRGGAVAAPGGRSWNPRPTGGATNPARYSVQPIDEPEKQDEGDWKTGPLVYESSSATTLVDTVAPAQEKVQQQENNVSNAAGPMSFAAMARRANQPPPPPAPKPIAQPPPPPVVEEPVYAPAPVEEPPASIPVPTPDTSITTPKAAPTPITAEPEPEPDHLLDEQTSVAETWTHELKDQLGIGSSTVDVEPESAHAPISFHSTFHEPVEFIGGTGAQPLSEYHFGFSAPEPEPATPIPLPQDTTPLHSHVSPIAAAVPPHPVQVPQPPPIYATRFPQQPTQPLTQPAHQISPVMDREAAGASAALKASPPTSYAGHHSGASRGLSYDQSTSVNYEPRHTALGALGSGPRPPAPQQAPSQPAPPPQSMFPQSMPPHPYYGNMYNMYSPVPGMRSAMEDPYAQLMQYPFNMGQIDLSTILPQGTLTGAPPPQQSQQQNPRTEHADPMAPKYGGLTGARTDSISGPPPGFGGGSYMTQPSISSLLVQQQQAQAQAHAANFNQHPFNFMMPSVSGGAQRSVYEDDRRGGLGSGAAMGGLGGVAGGAGRDQVRGSHHAQATPPPQHPQHAQQGGSATHYGGHSAHTGHGGGYGNLGGSNVHKKPYNNWNN